MDNTRPGLCPAGMCNGGFGCQHSVDNTKQKWESLTWQDRFKQLFGKFEVNGKKQFTEKALELFIEKEIAAAEERSYLKGKQALLTTLHRLREKMPKEFPEWVGTSDDTKWHRGYTSGHNDGLSSCTAVLDEEIKKLEGKV